jgi:hypothetical protein
MKKHEDRGSRIEDRGSRIDKDAIFDLPSSILEVEVFTG